MSSKSKGSPSKRRHVSRSDSSQEGDNVEIDEQQPQAKDEIIQPNPLTSPKRRKVPSTEPQPQPQPQQQHLVSPSIDEINSIIGNLSLPDPHIQVAIDHANDKTSNTEVQAYAKLAGTNWTYYVQTLKVVIGRSSDPNQQQQQQQQQDQQVHIDLGPAKVVSRRHASIQYNQDGRYWELTILGRNGVRIDKISHKEGTTRLFSGNILDIGGVQMMFVLPDVEPTVAQSFLTHSRNKSKQQQDYDQVAAAAGLVSLSPGRNNQSIHKFENTIIQNDHEKQQEFVAAATLAGASLGGGGAMGLGNAINGLANASYPRGVAMITRPQVRGVLQTSHYVDQDLSIDDAKDIKPPFSYATMITQAIMSSDEMMLSLADIYEWIMSKYSFYRHSKSGWQNSIRHNLSLNKAFEKVPRRANESGKGMKWQINELYKDEYIQKANVSKPGRIRFSPMVKQQIQFSQHPTSPVKYRFQDGAEGGLVSPVQSQAQLQSPSQSQSHPSLHSPTSQSQPQLLSPSQSQSESQPSLPQLPSTLPPPVAKSAATYQQLPPLLSPFPVLQHPSEQQQQQQQQPPLPQEDRKLQIGFMTPQKPPAKTRSGYPDSLDTQYSDQYGLPGAATNPTSTSTSTSTNPIATSTSTSTTTSTLIPSPSRSYLAATTAPGQISQLEAYTPERGSGGGATIINQVNKSLTNGGSNVVTNNPPSTTSASTSTTSQPESSTTTSTTTASNGNPQTQPGQFIGLTPARQTSHLQLAPPSSAQQQQLPSSFMPGSSPAPFWKMTQFSSTPIRSTEFSPSKFSSPPVSSQTERHPDGSDDSIGDLQDVDLTRYGKKKQQLW